MIRHGAARFTERTTLVLFSRFSIRIYNRIREVREMWQLRELPNGVIGDVGTTLGQRPTVKQREHRTPQFLKNLLSPRLGRDDM